MSYFVSYDYFLTVFALARHFGPNQPSLDSTSAFWYCCTSIMRIAGISIHLYCTKGITRMQLQIRWKDTVRQYHDVTYRGCIIKRYKGGWIITNINPTDTNIYHCIECAENAIDQQLIDKPRKKTPIEKHMASTLSEKLKKTLRICKAGHTGPPF